LSNANNDVGALPSNYTTESDEVFVRIENNLYPDCFDTTSFLLTVNPLPSLVTLENLSYCDNMDDGDDSNGIIQTFDLESQTPLIIGGQTDILVHYYISAIAAEDAVVGAELGSPYTNSTPFLQTVYYRTEIGETGCHQIGSFDLIVAVAPTIGEITPFEVCDTELNDGFAPFTLTDKNEEILAGQINVGVFYYETEALANAGVPGTALSSPYTNIVAYNQSIWVRLDSWQFRPYRP